MVETKVLAVCGGLVVVVAFGIYVCSWKLRRVVRSNDQEAPVVAASVQQHVRHSSKDLSEPLLGRSESYVGRTWKRPKGIKQREEEAAVADLENQGWRKRDNSDDRENQCSVITAAAAAADVNNVCSSKLQLEVIAGPSAGSRLGQKQGGLGVSLIIGRIAQNDLVLNDPEVSGKHVAITWNIKVSKWELVDMGSLNGTLVNGQQVAASDVANSQPRHRGHLVALTNGDVITLGSSQVLVQIGAGMKGSQLAITAAPFGVGVGADAMTMRRGGKQLPMEDVCLCEWPLQGFQESSIGIFCVFDGHGGVAGAKAASRIMPQKIVEILAVEETWAAVLRNGDASDVLRAAFHRTEEALDHEYEGCTATVLLLWPDNNTGFYAQCANVGDSHCIISMGDQQVLMTEDHRLTNPSERLRLLQMGRQLKDGETRICGMNIARALGDKFLKEQDTAFSALPHISDVRRLTVESKAMVIIASDGLWDVLSPQRGVQLAAEAREGKSLEDGRKPTPQTAQGIAEYLLNKARNLRTKDNTSVIVLDFGSTSKPSFHTL